MAENRNTKTNALFDFQVTGVDELVRNLAAFGTPKILFRIIGISFRAGAMIPLRAARVNARKEGLDFTGTKTRRHAAYEGLGHGHGLARRYGRIPRSLKVNRLYIPRKSGITDAYRMNVVARTQRGKGIKRNAAPHAHLIEYGYTHTGSQRKIAARPFMGPALDQTAPQVVDTVAKRMQALIDGLKFPTTGKGP